MHAAVYARVSTKAQVDKEASIPEQVERCSELARSLGAISVQSYVDEGFSGADSNRPALLQLLEDVKTGATAIVVCYSVDRWARDLADQLACARAVERHARLEFFTHPMGQSPEDILFFQMRGAFAQFERALIRQRTAVGRRRKAEKGLMVIPGAPFGYRYNGNKDMPQLLVDEPEAQVVRRIFAWVVQEGYGKDAIRRQLWAERVPSPKGSRTWGLSTVQRLLRNPTYKGEFFNFKWKTEYRDGKVKKVTRAREDWRRVEVPAIIEPAVWEAAQQRIALNGKATRSGRKYDYLLSGMIYCGECGRRLAACPQKETPWYRCIGQRNLQDPCSARMVPATSSIGGRGVDDAVWKQLLQVLCDPRLVLEALGRAQKQQADREVLTQSMDSLREELKKLDTQKGELLELRLEGLITPEDLRRQLQLLETRRRDAESRLRVKSECYGGQFPPDLTEAQVQQLVAWATRVTTSAQLDEKRRILQALNVKVTVNANRTLEVASALPLEVMAPCLESGISSDVRCCGSPGRSGA